MSDEKTHTVIGRRKNGTRCKIKELTRQEKIWVEVLREKKMTGFTAREACNVIKHTPCKKGKPRRQYPEPIKLCYVLKKTEDFIQQHGPSTKAITTWLYVGRDY